MKMPGSLWWTTVVCFLLISSAIYLASATTNIHMDNIQDGDGNNLITHTAGKNC